MDLAKLSFLPPLCQLESVELGCQESRGSLGGVPEAVAAWVVEPGLKNEEHKLCPGRILPQLDGLGFVYGWVVMRWPQSSEGGKDKVQIYPFDLRS